MFYPMLKLHDAGPVVCPAVYVTTKLAVAPPAMVDGDVVNEQRASDGLTEDMEGEGLAVVPPVFVTVIVMVFVPA